jgi:hypothetical protein
MWLEPGVHHATVDVKVAILRPDAQRLANTHRAAYEIAVSILSGLTESLRNPEYLAGGPPTTVAVALGT